MGRANKDAKRKARAKELIRIHKATKKKAKEGVPSSHQGTRWISSKVAGALVLVFGSLVMIAFGQMVKETTKNAR
ncbi:hypothetical protein Hanom_Chr04g00287311 [Helianthus anomalus]